MASGHVNRIQRRTHGCTDQGCTREESACQPGAVHTGPFTSFRCAAAIRPESEMKPTCRERRSTDAVDPEQTSIRRGFRDHGASPIEQGEYVGLVRQCDVEISDQLGPEPTF
jgi:hypothetical protein